MPSTPVQKQRKLEQQAIAIRDEVLRECGWPVEKRRKLLGGALRVYQRQLDAKKAIATDGEITYVDDNQAQLRAAEAITTLEGVNVGKSQEGSSTGPVHIHIGGVLGQIWSEGEPTISGGQGILDICHPSKSLEEHE